MGSRDSGVGVARGKRLFWPLAPACPPLLSVAMNLSCESSQGKGSEVM